MAEDNGPIGRDEGCPSHRILDRVRGRLLRRGKRAQALVETALLFPLLMLLIMGSADLGRVFYYSIELANSAREGARQGTYYDPKTASNVYDTYADVLAAVQAEAPDLTLSTPVASPSHCLTGSPSSWSAYYPTQPDSGYVFMCFDGVDTQSTPAQNTVGVMILYNFGPVTPLAQVVGTGTIHVLSTVTMQVQQHP